MATQHTTWTPLPSLPDKEGFAGMFAGACGKTLICCGGTNFPDKPMLEGGAKCWTDKIYTLADGADAWKEAGTLPFPYAYGASVSIKQGLLCIGGCDKNGHRTDVLLANVRCGRLSVKEFPALPKALAYTGSAVLDGKIYLIGGCERPGEQECTNSVYMLDPDHLEAGWQEQAPLPGRGRFLMQTAVVGDTLYVIGGIGLVPNGDKMARELLTEVLSYNPATGWTPQTSMPYPVAAAPTPAPVSKKGVIFILGGDDGSGKKYTPQTNPGFNNQSLCFDTVTGTWQDAGSIEAPRAVLPCCAMKGGYALFNGELKPGKRSNQVWKVSV